MVEIATKKYVSYRERNKKLTEISYDSELTHGTKDIFLIWIKCIDLKKFTLCNNPRIVDDWKPIFEPL